MAIKRRVRWCGGSLGVTIPSQIAALYEIQEGDYVEFTTSGIGKFRIKKGVDLSHYNTQSEEDLELLTKHKNMCGSKTF